MKKIMGKEYQKNAVLYFISLICSIIIILNILFALVLKESIFNLNTLAGILMFFYSWKNLFSEKK